MNLQKMAQLHKIIFDNEFPVESVLVHEIPLNFIFSDIVFPVNLQKRLIFLDDVIKCQKTSQKFISFLPHTVFHEISAEYQNFQVRVGESLLNVLKDFVNTSESKGLWRIYKNSDPRCVINIVNNTLNTFQKQWIMLNANQDAKDNVTMVSNIFEMLQPWLDKELYAKMKEEAEFSSVRKNMFYDDDDEDDRLRAKAKKLVAEKAKAEAKAIQKQKKVVDDDLDIIILGDE